MDAYTSVPYQSCSTVLKVSRQLSSPPSSFSFLFLLLVLLFLILLLLDSSPDSAICWVRLCSLHRQKIVLSEVCGIGPLGQVGTLPALPSCYLRHGTRKVHHRCVFKLVFLFLFSEYSDGGRPPQGRKKGCSSFPGNSGKRSPHYELGGGEPQPSHLQEDDGNVVKRDVQEDPEVRQ